MASCVDRFFIFRACMGSKAHVYVCFMRLRCRACVFFVRALVPAKPGPRVTSSTDDA